MFNTASANNDCLKEAIRSRLLQTGACAVGFAAADAVDDREWSRFENWLCRGDNAGMEYMRNHPDIRHDPRRLLEGAASVIALAFPFSPPHRRRPEDGFIAVYAYGRDYHKELRKIIKPALKDISRIYSSPKFRICIDSAPALDRYWAIRSGIGFPGDNGSVIIPEFGSMVFLMEIFTDIRISPDMPLDKDCGHCGACVRACPGNAIRSDATVDCRRCISYLTIEHHGEWTDPESLNTMSTPRGQNTIFGCDACLEACPYNHDAPHTSIEAFLPSEAILSLTADDIRGLGSDEELHARIPGSPLARAGLTGLHRNINNNLTIKNQTQ